MTVIPIAENIEMQNAIPVAEVVNIQNVQNSLQDDVEFVETEYIFEEKYCGPKTICCCLFWVIIFWPASIFIPCCPCDKRRKSFYRN